MVYGTRRLCAPINSEAQRRLSAIPAARSLRVGRRVETRDRQGRSLPVRRGAAPGRPERAARHRSVGGAQTVVARAMPTLVARLVAPLLGAWTRRQGAASSNATGQAEGGVSSKLVRSRQRLRRPATSFKGRVSHLSEPGQFGSRSRQGGATRGGGASLREADGTPGWRRENPTVARLNACSPISAVQGRRARLLESPLPNQQKPKTSRPLPCGTGLSADDNRSSGQRARSPRGARRRESPQVRESRSRLPSRIPQESSEAETGEGREHIVNVRSWAAASNSAAGTASSGPPAWRPARRT